MGGGGGIDGGDWDGYGWMGHRTEEGISGWAGGWVETIRERAFSVSTEKTEESNIAYISFRYYISRDIYALLRAHADPIRNFWDWGVCA